MYFLYRHGLLPTLLIYEENHALNVYVMQFSKIEKNLYRSVDGKNLSDLLSKKSGHGLASCSLGSLSSMLWKVCVYIVVKRRTWQFSIVNNQDGFFSIQLIYQVLVSKLNPYKWKRGILTNILLQLGILLSISPGIYLALVLSIMYVILHIIAFCY